MGEMRGKGRHFSCHFSWVKVAFFTNTNPSFVAKMLAAQQQLQQNICVDHDGARFEMVTSIIRNLRKNMLI